VLCAAFMEASHDTLWRILFIFFFHLGYLGFAPDILPDSDVMRICGALVFISGSYGK
jgi:hypothetical protein